MRRRLRKLITRPFVLCCRLLTRLSPRAALRIRGHLEVTRRMDYGPQDIYLAIDSDIEYDVRLHSCKKEPETVDWIQRFVKEGDVVYDVGANVGAYSLVASKFSGGTAKVYAFEPSFSTFTQLCRNVMLNNCEDSVIPLPIALSDETNLNLFYYCTLAPGGSLHGVGESAEYEGEKITPVWHQMLLCYRLDDLINTFCLPPPNHVKLDVDGHELAILRGWGANAIESPAS